MDIISEGVYIPPHRRVRKRRPELYAALGLAAAVYTFERRTGALSHMWKSFSRAFAAALAALIEDASGAALFTLEGEEPPDVDARSYFPDMALPNPEEVPRSSTPESLVRTRTPDRAEPDRSVDSASNASKEAVKDLDVPKFLMSTKFFACLSIDDSRSVADATTTIRLGPHNLLFSAGSDGSSGIYVVVEGSVGMFLPDGDQLAQTNTLRPGESVGDLDIVDGACRSITCMALEQGAVLVQLPRRVFLDFLRRRPAALQQYLQHGVARLWRVANFILTDYLNLPFPTSSSREAYYASCMAQGGSPSAAAALTPQQSGWRAGLQSPLSDPIAQQHSPSTPAGVKKAAGPASEPERTGLQQERVDAVGTHASMSESPAGTGAGSGAADTQQPAPGAQTDSPTAVLRSAGPRSPLENVPQGLEGAQDASPAGVEATLVDLSLQPSAAAPGGVEVRVQERNWEDASAAVPGVTGRVAEGQAEARRADAGVFQGGAVYVPEEAGSTAVIQSLHQLKPMHQDALAAVGWDCVHRKESGLVSSTIQTLKAHSRTFVTLVVPAYKSTTCCRTISLAPGTQLMQRGRAAGQMLLVLDGVVTLQRASGSTSQQATAERGSLLGAAALLCTSTPREDATTATACQVLAVSTMELQNLLTICPQAYLNLLFTASKALSYCIRKFVSLGLNRVWLHAGDIAYEQGVHADSMYVVISGRVRLASRRSTGGKRVVHVEEEVGRGQTIGAVWAVAGRKHDTTAIAVRDSELVRMSCGSFEVISRAAPNAAAKVLTDMAARMTSARASTHKRSNPSIRRLALDSSVSSLPPFGVSPQPDTLQRGDIAIIVLVPAGAGNLQNVPRKNRPVRKLSAVLRRALQEHEGTCLSLTLEAIRMLFPVESRHLHVPFHRTKVTSWMAQQEEDHRFILLETDHGDDPNWSKLCIEQADCILLVASESASPEVTAFENETVWQRLSPPEVSVEPPHRMATPTDAGSPGGGMSCTLSTMDTATLGQVDAASGAAFTSDYAADEDAPESCSSHDWLRFMRRVELVLLHPATCQMPSNTLPWLRQRPLLARHHHVRIDRAQDIDRLRRWMAGKAVGLVLSGGGSRGLAHLGVMQALDDLGVPVDVVGGTSQGAFMAALYAQDLPRDVVLRRVRRYAAALSSPRHLLSDVTLPVLSLFSGTLFDRVLKETFSGGPQLIEDLWLPFFCVSTNLSKAQVEVHRVGCLWQLVRASMTIVGMVPPVIKDGDMLVDGGYLNNIPVDVMHSLGVCRVLVVDVEDKQSGTWHNLTPHDGGISGWRLLWDRVCPFPALRIGGAAPRYRELVNALSWIAHSQNLRRMCQDYHVDLYLRPPHIGAYKLMDYHLIDRIVRNSYRYAWSALTEWTGRMGRSLGLKPAYAGRRSTGLALTQRAASMDEKQQRGAVPVMSQLQAQKNPSVNISQEEADSGRPRQAFLVNVPGTHGDAVVAPLPAQPGASLAVPPDSRSAMEHVLPHPGDPVLYMQSELMRQAQHDGLRVGTRPPAASPPHEFAAARAAPQPPAEPAAPSREPGGRKAAAGMFSRDWREQEGRRSVHAELSRPSLQPAPLDLHVDDSGVGGGTHGPEASVQTGRTVRGTGGQNNEGHDAAVPGLPCSDEGVSDGAFVEPASKVLEELDLELPKLGQVVSQQAGAAGRAAGVLGVSGTTGQDGSCKHLRGNSLETIDEVHAEGAD